MSILVFMSTVLIKQHVILDFIGAETPVRKVTITEENVKHKPIRHGALDKAAFVR